MTRDESEGSETALIWNVTTAFQETAGNLIRIDCNLYQIHYIASGSS